MVLKVGMIEIVVTWRGSADRQTQKYPRAGGHVDWPRAWPLSTSCREVCTGRQTGEATGLVRSAFRHCSEGTAKWNSWPCPSDKLRAASASRAGLGESRILTQRPPGAQ
jgi:hypothetical protein